jgi:rRNA-processing protein FCF1
MMPDPGHVADAGPITLGAVAALGYHVAMIVPLLLLVLSLAGLAVALFLPGYADLVLLAGPMAVASLLVVLHAWRRRRGRQAGHHQPAWIVIDGSNVMHWADQTPKIAPVREVVRHLQDRGFTPGVVFDANAGYLLEGRYRHDRALGQRLGLPTDRVMVVDKGTPADPALLTAARDMQARVVTNDRFRDWADAFPEVRHPGFLIRGGYHDGALWLDLDAPAATARGRADHA